MKTILVNVALLFVVRTHGSSDKHRVLNSVLDSVYNLGPDDNGREKEFVTKMWHEVSSLIPDSVEIPKFRENLSNGNLCADEAKIHLEFGTGLSEFTFQKDRCLDSGNCIQAAFEVDVRIKNKVSYTFYLEDNAQSSAKHESQDSKTRDEFCKTSVFKSNTATYTFGGENRAKIWLSIPDFEKDRSSIPLKCVIYVDAITIENVNDPTIENNRHNKAPNIGERYWESVKGDDIITMMRIGVMKGLLDSGHCKTRTGCPLQAGESLICLSSYYTEKLFNDINNHALDNGVDIPAPGGGTEVVKLPDKPVYQKINTLGLIGSFLIGIENSVSELRNQPSRDILVRDFVYVVKSSLTSKPDVSGRSFSFNFYTYAPVAFSYFRKSFGIREDDYLDTLCHDDLKEISNPAKSGSGLYISKNKKFIAKTVQRVEVLILQNFLTGYFFNVYQNPNTFLSQFYGLYAYEDASILTSAINNMRLIIMRNIMPADKTIDQKYDLKGSTHEREASKKEKNKKEPTFKDIDFRIHHGYGLYLKAKDYDRLKTIFVKDTSVLASFEIMDYSLLLGLHYVDKRLTKEERDQPTGVVWNKPCQSDSSSSDDKSDRNYIESGIPAYTVKNDRLLLYVGIIDILQSFRLKKKLEVGIKTIIHTTEEIDVAEPKFYADRFMNFMFNEVFRKMEPCAPVKKEKPARKLSSRFEHLKTVDNKKQIGNVGSRVNSSTFSMFQGTSRSHDP